MSSPTNEQVFQALDRFSTLLDEYDDVRYALVIRDDNGMWNYLTRLKRRDQVVLARGLLDDALQPRRKKKRH